MNQFDTLDDDSLNIFDTFEPELDSKENKEFQEKMANNMMAQEIVSMKTGHLPMLTMPQKLAEILNEFKIISSEIVKDDELSLIKSSMNGDFSRSLESPQTIARFAFNIIKNQLDPDYYKTYLQRLDEISKEYFDKIHFLP